MKRLYYYLFLFTIAFALMGLTACSKDDIEPKDLIKSWDSISGTFHGVSINDDEGYIRIEFVNDGKANVIFNGEKSVVFDVVTYDLYKDFITFRGGRIFDGTYQVTLNDYGTLTIASGGISVSFRENNENVSSLLSSYIWQQKKGDDVSFIFRRDMKTGWKNIETSRTTYFIHDFTYTLNPNTKQLFVDYDDKEPDEKFDYIVVMNGKDIYSAVTVISPKKYLLLFKQDSSTNYTCVMKLINIGGHRE